jgi:hypothetical protein
MPEVSMITLVPSAGLANRIRAISSARCLADETGHDLTVIWKNHRHLASAFHELFEPSGKVRMVDTAAFGGSRLRRWNLLGYRLRKNKSPVLWQLAGLAKRLRFDTVLRGRKVKEIMIEGWDLDRVANARNMLIVSNSQFFQGPFQRDMFVPVAELRDRIDAVAGAFDAYTVGVQIRRTDFKASIANSPEEIFVLRMNGILDERPDAMFFLATDCADTEARMRQAFAGRIMTAAPERSRSTGTGIKDAVVDLFCLARTNYILGSHASSFGKMAGELGGVEMEIVERGVIVDRRGSYSSQARECHLC